MKKILVVFMILAVAGGVFAQQGSWSLSGGVEIGSYIDFAPNDKDLEPIDEALFTGSGYFAPYNYYNFLNGKLGLNYSREALSIGLTFNTLGSDDIFNGDVNYDGGNYKLQAASNLRTLINGGSRNVGRLWGYYKLVNELVHLEIAYNSRDTKFWTSDTTGSFGDVTPYTSWSPILNLEKSAANYSWSGPFGLEKDSFLHFDHSNYLLTSIDLEGLSFGIVLPSLFIDNTDSDAIDGGVHTANAGNKAKPWETPTTFPKLTGAQATSGGYSFVDQVLMKSVFGLKFTMFPVEVAAQFMVKDYGVYFGGKFNAGPVTIGLSFMGIFGNTSEDPADGNYSTVDGVVKGNTFMKVGGSVNYDAGAFGANIKAAYGMGGNTSDKYYTTQIGVEPGFFYKVIPSHLLFKTDIGFYFTDVYDGLDEKNTDLSNVRWAVQPQIFWNFLGTGAGEYYGFNTGMIFRYRVLSDVTNALDINFRFSF